MRQRQVSEAGVVGRIGFDEGAELLRRLLVVLHDPEVVIAERPEFFSLGHPIGQRERGLPRRLRLFGAPEPLRADGDARVRAAEFRIELDGAPVVRQRFLVAAGQRQILRGRVLPERLE